MQTSGVRCRVGCMPPGHLDAQKARKIEWIHMGVEPNIWENPPNHPFVHRVFSIIFTIHFQVHLFLETSIFTLPETNITSPLKIGAPCSRETPNLESIHFSGANMLVLGSVKYSNMKPKLQVWKMIFLLERGDF